MKAQEIKVQRDGNHISPWQENIPSVNTETKYNPDTIYDCLVIGAGITGVTTALMIQKSDKSVLLADSHTAGFGTTGGTSAHINTFADTSYKQTEQSFGKESSRLFADSILEGMNIIKKNIETYGIDCDFDTKPAYVYAEDKDQLLKLEDLYGGTLEAGVNIAWSDKIPIPVPFKKAAILEGQAQFHPLKYLGGILKAYIEAGGLISENTAITKIETTEGIHTAQASGKSFRARKVIYATHIPPGINVFSFRCAPYRSYVIGVKLKSRSYPDALIYDMQEPYHYFRTHHIEGEPVLLVGGNDHKTGHDGPAGSFEHLEKYVRKYFDVSSVKYKWSSQYYIPVDGLPYIGQMPFYADGIYCATGYNGNGMMLGSVSAKILTDAVLDIINPYANLFSPSRIKPIEGFTEFVKENADVAYRFLADRLSVQETDSLKTLKRGMGKILDFEGKKVAAYRDEEGKIHALSPVCTHAGCIVSWNKAEKSWDCPCHGARYDIDGTVLNSPAVNSLRKFDF